MESRSIPRLVFVAIIPNYHSSYFSIFAQLSRRIRHGVEAELTSQKDLGISIPAPFLNVGE